MKTKHTLSKTEIEYLSSQTSIDGLLLGLWRLLLGAREYDDATSVNPRRHSIPKPQWLFVCGLFNAVSPDGGLMMMDSGPTAH